jgi:hypothetical protein
MDGSFQHHHGLTLEVESWSEIPRSRFQHIPGFNTSKAWVRGIAPDPEHREKDDWYPTPRAAVDALLSVEAFSGPIWECACGDGAISTVLEEYGHTVFSSDLIDRGYGEPNVDFLEERHPRAPNIITNPPFKHIEAFIAKSLELTNGKVALLGRLALLEGSSRRFMFESTPLARVWVFSRRLTIMRARHKRKRKAGGMIAFAWFVWDHEHRGKPTLGWL